jgi:hypothetical protein
MNYREITETEPVKPSVPLTPTQARRRAERQQKAQARLTATRATAAIRINGEKEKLSEI